MSSLSVEKRKRKVLNIEDKLNVINDHLKNNVSVKILSQKYGVGIQTVYDILKNKERLLKFCSESDSVIGFRNRKALKSAEEPKVDFAVYEWFRQERFKGTPISGLMVKEKAKIFHSKLDTNSECAYSNGWLQNFKKRHGIHKLRAEGEKSSADYIAATMFVEKFNEYILTEKLTKEQIYNGDETALFWKCLPESSLACHNENFIDGHKVSKERLTTLLCANAAGTHKCKVLVIGKSARPRALKNVKDLPVIYNSNAKAWVTQQIFLEWFKNNFVPEVREHFKKIGLKDDSKILLLLDNCPAHPDAKDFNAENVIVKFFPPNCTSLIQPMDQGAIWSFKCHYRKTIVQKLVTTSNREEYKKTFNIKKALWSIDNAWNAVTSAVLKNVWNNLFCPENEGVSEV